MAESGLKCMVGEVIALLLGGCIYYDVTMMTVVGAHRWGEEYYF